jgi:hypothetical protein
MRPLRETYKGRRLLVKKAKEWGYLESYINGETLGRPMGRTPEAMERELASLRGWVDAADERRLTDPTAYPAHYYEGAPSAGAA